MCCEECTIGGIATTYGKDIYNSTPSDQRWRLYTHCPKMVEDHDYGRDGVMWGICRISENLEKVECCIRCNYFS